MVGPHIFSPQFLSKQNAGFVNLALNVAENKKLIRYGTAVGLVSKKFVQRRKKRVNKEKKTVLWTNQEAGSNWSENGVVSFQLGQSAANPSR